MQNLKRKWLASTLALMLTTTGTAAKDRGGDAAGSPLLKALAACRGVAAADERLRCYDMAAERLGAAVQAKSVIVVDRSELARAQREEFGKRRPDRGLPGVPVEDTDVSEIAGVIKAASQVADGNWSILLTDGSVWRQTDDATLGREPRNGDKVIVRKAALGSFKMRIGGQPAIRVRRLT